MVSCSINPFHDVLDITKRDAIVKALTFLYGQDQTKEDLIQAIGSNHSPEWILNEMQMFGLVQAGAKDGFITLTERGEFALNEMK